MMMSGRSSRKAAEKSQFIGRSKHAKLSSESASLKKTTNAPIAYSSSTSIESSSSNFAVWAKENNSGGLIRLYRENLPEKTFKNPINDTPSLIRKAGA